MWRTRPCAGATPTHPGPATRGGARGAAPRRRAALALSPERPPRGPGLKSSSPPRALERAPGRWVPQRCALTRSRTRSGRSRSRRRVALSLRAPCREDLSARNHRDKILHTRGHFGPRFGLVIESFFIAQGVSFVRSEIRVSLVRASASMGVWDSSSPQRIYLLEPASRARGSAPTPAASRRRMRGSPGHRSVAVGFKSLARTDEETRARGRRAARDEGRPDRRREGRTRVGDSHRRRRSTAADYTGDRSDPRSGEILEES